MNDHLILLSFEADAQFAELTDEGRNKVRERCAALERILKVRKKGKAITAEAKALSVADSTIRSWITKYKNKHGHWSAVMDKRCEPHTEQALPKAFVEFWKDLCERSNRSALAAHRVLKRLYHARAVEWTPPNETASIPLWPGYAQRPAPSIFSKDDLPRGWSYQNLKRPGNALTKVEEVMAHRGPVAASQLLEKVLSTRRGLRPGQHYVPDDCWPDIDVTVAPSLSMVTVRLVELGCGDIASAKKIAWGLTAQTTDDEGKRQYIKKRDMRYLVAKVMCTIGFHKDGVTWWVEHGSAGIDPELEAILVRLCASIGVPCRIERSGGVGGKSRTFNGGYATFAHGNYRHKASYESSHNLSHNERGMLPGQTGSNSRVNAVETMAGRKKEASDVLTAVMDLAIRRPSVLKAFRTGHYMFADYFWAHDQVEKNIANYTDHHLQNWEEAGFMVHEFRMGPIAPWQPMEDLLDPRITPAHKAALDAYFAITPGCTRVRRMSREEAWATGEADLVRLPRHCVPEILGKDHSRMVTVSREGQLIVIKDVEISSEPLLYSAWTTDVHGLKKPLTSGQSYRAWINPFDQSLLFIAGENGNYLGYCERREGVSRDDDNAANREAGQVAKRNNEILAPFISRQRARDRQATRDRKHNINLFSGGASTEEDKEVENYVDAETAEDTSTRPSFPSAPVPETEADPEPKPIQRPKFSKFLK